MKAVSRGHLTIARDCVRIDRYTVSVQDGPSYDNPSHLADWTYYQGLEVAFDIVVDLPGAFESLRMPFAELGAVLTWQCKRTGLRGLGPLVPLRTQETQVVASIAPGMVRGELQLTPRIILIDSGGDAGPGAPTQGGAILWQPSQPVSVRLEGIGARMPVISAPAKGEPFMGSTTARWKVEIDSSDLEVPVDAAMTVIINESSPDVSLMLDEPETPVAKVLQGALLLDVNRELVRVAISDRGIETDRAYPEGSLGALMALQVGLMGESPEVLRVMAAQDPAQFDVEVQAKLGTKVTEGLK